MDSKGKTEIERTFADYGFKPYQVEVVTNPGNEDLPYLLVEAYNVDPAHVITALAKAGFMRAGKVNGPRLFLMDWDPTHVSVKGRIDSFLFEDRNSPDSPNRDR